MEAATSSDRYWRETADHLEKKVAQLRIRVSGTGNSEHARRGSSRELDDSYPTSLQDDFKFHSRGSSTCESFQLYRTMALFKRRAVQSERKLKYFRV